MKELISFSFNILHISVKPNINKHKQSKIYIMIIFVISNVKSAALKTSEFGTFTGEQLHCVCEAIELKIQRNKLQSE
jgi:hypothetical protein